MTRAPNSNGGTRTGREPKPLWTGGGRHLGTRLGVDSHTPRKAVRKESLLLIKKGVSHVSWQVRCKATTPRSEMAFVHRNMLEDEQHKPPVGRHSQAWNHSDSHKSI